MSVFAYNPEAVGRWSNNVMSLLNGSGDSIAYCSKKFNSQIEALVQPNVWTGPAAMQNFKNFMETHNVMVKFVNEFAQAYQESMTAVNKSVAQLESNNLGNISTLTFEDIQVAKLNEMSEASINTGVVTYDYSHISQIGSELKSILTSLETVKTNLLKEINKLNDSSGMWDGNAAESCKSSLNSVVSSNMQKITETLNVCISNISAAAEAAQMADAG